MEEKEKINTEATEETCEASENCGCDEKEWT